MSSLKISILLDDGRYHGICLFDLEKEGEKYGSPFLFMSEFCGEFIKEDNVVPGSCLNGYTSIKKAGSFADSIRSHWLSRHLTLTSDKEAETNVDLYELTFEDGEYYILFFDVEKDQPMVMYSR